MDAGLSFGEAPRGRQEASFPEAFLAVRREIIPSPGAARRGIMAVRPAETGSSSKPGDPEFRAGPGSGTFEPPPNHSQDRSSR